MSSAGFVEAMQQQQQQRSPSSAFFPAVDWALFIGIFGVVVGLFALRHLRSSSTDGDDDDVPPGFTRIPEAVGASAPLLGHALEYKRCPASFVVGQCATVGPIFSINLAGKRMIVVGNSEELLRQVACQPERVLSARAAVAQVGFDQMLGDFSVRRGTDLHKRILKAMLRSDTGGIDAQVPKLFQAVSDAIQRELPSAAAAVKAPDTAERSAAAVSSPPGPGRRVRVADFFTLVRRCMLRAMLHCLVGPAFAAAGGAEFVSDFIKFQDAVENATAQAAVLPRALALPMVLWPCAVRRWGLAKRVQRLMDVAFECATSGRRGPVQKLGPWLEAIRDPSLGLSRAEGAQLIISLLFAAHKNPAIGAAQTLMFLHGHTPGPGGDSSSGGGSVSAAPEESEGAKQQGGKMSMPPLDEAAAEASQFRDCARSERQQTTAAEALRDCHVIRRACSETLRLTAHTLGALRVVQQDVDLQDGTRRYRLSKGQTVALSHVASSWDSNLWGVDCRRFRPSRQEWLLGGAPEQRQATGGGGGGPTGRKSSFEPAASSAAEQHQQQQQRRGAGLRQRELGFVTGPHAAGLSPYKMTAFSHGVHVCPGQRFAMVAMQIMVAQFLEFNVHFESPVPPISFERATLAQRSATVVAALVCPQNTKIPVRD